jgi:hypothetical protein
LSIVAKQVSRGATVPDARGNRASPPMTLDNRAHLPMRLERLTG